MLRPTPSLIAKEDIKRGDILQLLWNNYCRKAKNDDSKIVGIAFDDTKRGDMVPVVKSITGTYESG